ncbi:MAG: methyltransferase domain-containing protein [Elusimicrobia bacterium]|nr:methyltransferase domain-containing protein [Elusimicrobiota bacterium]
MTPRDWSARSYRRRLLDESLAAVAADVTGLVLEVGTGTAGRRGRFRPPQHGRPWITVDVDGQRRPRVQADVLALPFADSAFDAALCLEVLEYVREPGLAMREIARVLRRGGRAVVSVPFLHRWDAPDDRWRWTPRGFRELIEATGLAVEVEHAHGGALATVANIVRQIGTAPERGWRRGLGNLLAYPVAELLFRADAWSADRAPVLSTFSTGYLAVARKP